MRVKQARLMFVVAWVCLAFPAAAEIYQYEDDNGYVHYTNDIASVPTEKLSEIIRYNELRGDDLLTAPASAQQVRRSTGTTAVKKTTRSQKFSQKKRLRTLKKSLENEYERLLKDKTALDNDKSFQKRRKKKKYKNRPYIKALVKKEQQMEKRLVEVETALAEIKRQL